MWFTVPFEADPPAPEADVVPPTPPFAVNVAANPVPATVVLPPLNALYRPSA